MVDTERKRKWIQEMIETRGKFLEKNRCDKCGQVGLGISSPVDLSFLCLECMGDVLFEKPDLDVKDFAKL